MVIYLGYIINEYQALHFFAYILTSLKWQHCLNVIIFRNIFVHAIIGWLVFSQWECLLTGFFEQPIKYHFLLAWHFLFWNFCVLLIIFKYSIYLVFFTKYFFSTQDCTSPISRGLASFGRHDLEMMFTDVTLWSLRLFMNIPLLIGKSFIFKDAC